MTERVAHPELVTQCQEDGKGWRRDEYANWWPCTEQDERDGQEQDRAAD